MMGATFGRCTARGDGEPPAVRTSQPTSCCPASPGACSAASADMAVECLVRATAAWYKPHLRREDAETILAGRSTGAFVICGAADGAHYLSFVVEGAHSTLGSGLRRKGSGRRRQERKVKVSHVPIEQCSVSGTYCLKGSSLPFDSLVQLAANYCLQRDVLPSLLQLPPAALDPEVHCIRPDTVADTCRCNRSNGSIETLSCSVRVCRGLTASHKDLTAGTSTVTGSRLSPLSYSDYDTPAASPLGIEGLAFIPVCTASTYTAAKTLYTVNWAYEQLSYCPPTLPCHHQPAAACRSTSLDEGTRMSVTTTMATVYTTTAFLDKPMHLMYDALSDSVKMSASENGVFSDRSISTSTKAVVHVGDALVDGGCKLGDHYLRHPLDESPLAEGGCDVVTPHGNRPTYYASPLDDRLSDYEDIWTPPASTDDDFRPGHGHAAGGMVSRYSSSEAHHDDVNIAAPAHQSECSAESKAVDNGISVPPCWLGGRVTLAAPSVTGMHHHSAAPPLEPQSDCVPKLWAEPYTIIRGSGRRGNGSIATCAAQNHCFGSSVARPVAEQRGRQQHAVTSTPVKGVPIRCDIIRSAGTRCQTTTAATGAGSSAAAHEKLSVQEALPLAVEASHPLRGSAAGTVGNASDRDSGAIDNDLDNSCDMLRQQFIDDIVGNRSGSSVVRTTSLKEKTTAVALTLPVKPQTLPVHLLRKPEQEELSADEPSFISCRTPSEIVDEVTAACSSTTGDLSSISQQCPKFPISLRLSSASGDDFVSHSDTSVNGSAPGADCHSLQRLIEATLPECVLPAICPLTSKNLLRLSVYDNVSPLRPDNRLSSGSSSTVFSKPWDTGRIEEMFENAKLRSRINTSALSEAQEDESEDVQSPPALSPTTPADEPMGAKEQSALVYKTDCVDSVAALQLRAGADVVGDQGRAVVLRQCTGRKEQHCCSGASRSSKYRRSVEFNRDLISARTATVYSSKAANAEEGDSGTELENTAQNGSSQKHQPDVIVDAFGNQARGDAMVYNDSQVSLKNFSDHVKQIRSAKSGSGRPCDIQPSAVIQAHICKLAKDRTTTFGSAVDNFIQCTRESNETNPHAILRNVRQFMSGIKNYLTQQGEGTFTELLHAMQRQLGPNEFLNVDAILEAALLKCVVLPLKATIDSAFVTSYTNNGSLKELADGIRIARSRSLLELGMKASLVPPQGQSMETIKVWLTKMQRASSPIRKLESLLSACSAIFSGIHIAGQTEVTSSLAAEDFLHVMTYVVSQCGLVSAEIEADYMRGLLQPSLSSGEGGYYLNTLSSSVSIMRGLARRHRAALAADPAGPLLSQQPKRASSCVRCTVGTLRVHVPNEATGSIMTRTVPVRPSMTAKEIRSMVAHKLFITNPHDYALYVVAGGAEHKLSDSDVVENFSPGMPSHVASAVVFKRISAHIVWPSVMS